MRGLAGAPVRVTIVDRRNYHLFQPLLYQAATASLAPSEIAWPIRQLFRRRPEVTTLLAAVETIDKEARGLVLDDGTKLVYDTLVLATGARHAYFGHDDWEAFAPGLKTLDDATNIRGRILLAFEEAERESDERKQAALMTFVVVGAGPTGVELAGAIAELARATLPGDFRRIDTRKARIVLIEAGSRVLPAFAEDLSDYAKQSLEMLGVEIALGHAVSECSTEGVVFEGGILAAGTIIWAAGVQASPAAKWVEAPADRAGRLTVSPDLTVPGHPEIFAIGDASLVLRPDGRPARHRAGRKAGGDLCGESDSGAASRDALISTLRLQARGRPRDDRKAARRDRLRVDQVYGGYCLVALGPRPHLLPHRRAQPAERSPLLALDLHARPAHGTADYP